MTGDQTRLPRLVTRRGCPQHSPTGQADAVNRSRGSAGWHTRPCHAPVLLTSMLDLCPGPALATGVADLAPVVPDGPLGVSR
jgi:hypothetical protein